MKMFESNSATIMSNFLLLTNAMAVILSLLEKYNTSESKVNKFIKLINSKTNKRDLA